MSCSSKHRRHAQPPATHGQVVARLQSRPRAIEDGVHHAIPSLFADNRVEPCELVREVAAHIDLLADATGSVG